MITQYEIVCPRDGLFCKDGRGWRTGENGRGHALRWPHPSTLLGALRAASGRAQEAREGGRWPRREWAAHTAEVRLAQVLTLARPLGEAEWKLEHRRWPTPHDAVYWRPEGDEQPTLVRRLEPQPGLVGTLGRDDDEAREALWRPRALERGKPQPRPQWWPEDAFVKWLCGEGLASAPASHDPVERTDVHLQIEPSTQAARESRLFSREIVETLVKGEAGVMEWALAVKLEAPAAITGPLLLGGDRRLCGLHSAPASLPSLFAMPDPLRDAFARSRSRGLRLVTVTAAAFAQGWRPDFLRRAGHEYRGTLAGAELVLRAAFVPRPIDVAGWDMAENRPKPLSRMVAPGAVYLLERTDGGMVDAALAEAVWLRAVGARESEGFGLMVPGVWQLDASSEECGAR